MEEYEGRDTYVTQLKEVFDSCDASGSGYLNENELRLLCDQLHLEEHTEVLVNHLFENESEVKFEDFKECFVAILTGAIPNSEDVSEDITSEEVADREVSPKFTLGRKKYGRRSRPASIVDEEGLASPFLSPQSSVEQSVFCDATFKSSGIENVAGKRPMSPSTSQQPPPKSGRMHDEQAISSPESSPSSRQASDSDPDLNQSFENNPVQYLQDTWKKLGIGQGGYLNVEELALVCEHIGMDMTEEVVAQLFEKLDCDQDGQISFDEFLQGLFQHGDPQSLDSPMMKSDGSKSIFNDGSRDDLQITNSYVSGIFSCIDPDHTGYAESGAITELWESLELSCPPTLLEELGFNSNMKISLSDLTTVLEEVLCNVLNRPLLQIAFVSFQNELQYLRQAMDQMRTERNKLRVNVEEANSRAALLAQEVDDNHAKLENSLHKKLLMMEKKYQEQARELVEELQQERDSMNSLTNKLKQELQKDMDVVRDEEAKLKCRLSSLEQENTRLETELQDATEKYMEMEKLNEVLQKELVMIPDLKQRLADLECHLNEKKEQSHQNLLQELEKCRKNNQELQDKIDELTLEMENMHQNSAADATPSKEVSRTHSWLSDYKKTVVTGFKRRGSDSSSDDNSDAESPTIGKLRKTFSSTGKQSSEPSISPKLIDFKKNTPLKGNNVNIDVLLRDMMLDQTHLLQKLQVAEEKSIKMERAYRQADNKNKILTGLVRNMASMA